MSKRDLPPERKFLRVADFDVRQNPRRPKRPSWLKMFVRDLDDVAYLSLSLTVRGFLADFQRLAADLENRVPYDVRFIARRIGAAPAVVGQALNTCLTHGFISRFALPLKPRINNELADSGDAQLIPPSLSNSNSHSKSTDTEFLDSTKTETDLTRELIDTVRQELATGRSEEEICDSLGVTRPQIEKIAATNRGRS